MDQGLIPRRYAKALYLYAVERHCDRPLYEVMRRLSAAFGREPGLNDALANPFVAYPDKQALVLAAVGGETGKEAEDAAFADFLKLLGQNKRLDMLREIALAYIAIYRKENRIFRVAVTTAAPVSSQDMKRIHALVGKHLPDGARPNIPKRWIPLLSADSPWLLTTSGLTLLLQMNSNNCDLNF